MPQPEIVITPDEVIPVERWQLWDDQFSIKTKLKQPGDEEGRPTGREVDFFYSLMYPVFPLNYISPVFLAYGYRNMWRVDSTTGERLENFPVQIGELEKLKVDYSDYAQKVSSIAMSKEAAKWGINKDNLRFFPEVQSRLEGWADALAIGDKVDRSGAIVPPIDDMPNLINRIRTFIPPSNFATSLLRTKQDVDKVSAVRQAWATALQRGDIDFGSQAQYTSMFARTLFESLLPREDMDVGDFQRVMRLVETPQGFQNFIQTVNTATQKAGERGLSPEGTQELIKNLTAQNILERLGAEPPSITPAQQPIAARREVTRSLTARDMGIDTSKGQFFSPDLARLIPEAESMGIDTSFTKPFWGSANPGPAIEGLMKQMDRVREEYLTKTSNWLRGLLPSEFQEWERTIVPRIGEQFLHPRWREAFVGAALMDEQTATDVETGIKDQFYLPGLREKIIAKLGSEAMDWLQNRQPSVNWAVPGEVTAGMVRIQEYTKRQQEYDALREQARIERERPKKVLKI